MASNTDEQIWTSTGRKIRYKIIENFIIAEIFIGYINNNKQIKIHFLWFM